MRRIRVATFAVLVLSSITAFAQTWHFRTLAGTTAGGGYVDAQGTSARFSSPMAAVVCGGAIYVADMGNHAIRKIGRDGVVTTWAGGLAQAGSADGTRSTARFRNPSGIAADQDCNLYVADRGNHTIRYVNAAGVSTIAGAAGIAGSADGFGTAARFNKPFDVAFDPSGAIWISDSGNITLRRLTFDERVTTIYGTAGVPGSTFGRLNLPLGVNLDANGALHIADSGNGAIKRITVSGTPTTVATTLYPSDVAFGSDGKLYMTTAEQVIRRADSGAASVTIAGRESRSGWRDGPGSEAGFDTPRGLTLDTDGSFIVADELSCTIRRMAPNGDVSTIAGNASTTGYADGVGTNARFQFAGDVDVDANGVAYVSDLSTIRRIARDGTVTTIAGVNGDARTVDGPHEVARFAGAGSIAIEPSGSIVVVEGNSIRRIALDGSVTTIVGSLTESGYRDAEGAEARFNYIPSIAVAPDGTIYACDVFNRAIRKIVGRTVTTLVRDTVKFNVPMGLDIDRDGNVLMWDENTSSVFRITPAGQVTTVIADPTLATYVQGLAVAADNTIYLGGIRFHSIFRLLPGASKIERFAGEEESAGNVNGTPEQARFRSPTRLDVAPDGRLFVRDGNFGVRVATLGELPQINSFAASPGSIKAGATATLSWSVSGGTARIEPSVGPVANSGTMTVTPQSSTTYTLTVTNDVGDVTANASVVVATTRRRATRR